MTEPLDAAWAFVDSLDPVLCWLKVVSAILIAMSLIVLPQPLVRSPQTPDGIHVVEWWLVMASRAGVLMGALNMMVSVVAFAPLGPLAETVFMVAMCTNVLCLLWCRRKIVWELIRSQRSPEMTVMRALIAGRKS